MPSPGGCLAAEAHTDAGCSCCDDARRAFRRTAQEGLRGLQNAVPGLTVRGLALDGLAERLSPARIRTLASLTSALQRAVGAEAAACRSEISGALVVIQCRFGPSYTRQLVATLVPRLSPASHILDVQMLVTTPLALRRAHAEAYLDVLVQLRHVTCDEPSWLRLLGTCLPIFEQAPGATQVSLARVVELLQAHGAAMDARTTLAVAEGLARPMDGTASQLALARLLRVLCRELSAFGHVAAAAAAAPRLSLVAQVARSSVAEVRALDMAWAQLPRPRPPGLTAHAVLSAMVQVAEQVGYAAAAARERHEARRALRTHVLHFVDHQMDEADVQQVFAAFLRAPGPAFVDVCIPLVDAAIGGARRAAHLGILSLLPAARRPDYVRVLMHSEKATQAGGVPAH